MIVTIHQPEHIPWTGYFHKMAAADSYVVLDTVQFTKNNFQNRNKIYCPNKGWTWLSVPVDLKGHTNTTIRDIQISTSNPKWRESYWGKIHSNYNKHKYYEIFKEKIKNIVYSDYQTILELNLLFINFFREVLDIDTPIFMSSELEVKGVKTDLLLNICNKMNATTYLSGPSGKYYLDKEIFSNANISLDFHQYTPPEYSSPDYTPYMSSLDIIMNCGYGSRDIILGSR